MRTELELKAHNNRLAIKSVRRCLSISEWDDQRKLEEIRKVIKERDSYTDAGLGTFTASKQEASRTEDDWMLPRKGDSKNLLEALKIPRDVRRALLDRMVKGEGEYKWMSRQLWSNGTDYLEIYRSHPLRTIYSAEVVAALLEGMKQDRIIMQMVVVPGTKLPRCKFYHYSRRVNYLGVEWFTDFPDHLRRKGSVFGGRGLVTYGEPLTIAML